MDRHRFLGPREEVPSKGFPKMPVVLGQSLRVRLGIASNLMALRNSRDWVSVIGVQDWDKGE